MLTKPSYLQPRYCLTKPLFEATHILLRLHPKCLPGPTTEVHWHSSTVSVEKYLLISVENLTFFYLVNQIKVCYYYHISAINGNFSKPVFLFLCDPCWKLDKEWTRQKGEYFYQILKFPFTLKLRSMGVDVSDKNILAPLFFFLPHIHYENHLKITVSFLFHDFFL